MRNLIFCLFVFGFFTFFITSCDLQNIERGRMIDYKTIIDDATIDATIKELKDKFGEQHSVRIEKGVRQAAAFWREADGSKEAFTLFCSESFIDNDEKLKRAFEIISRNQEILSGLFNKMNLLLMEPLHLDMGELTELDVMYGSYAPSSHINEDFYNNKIAFYILLNFPHYSIDEKNANMQNWTRLDWALAKVGDLFYSRTPPEILLNYSTISTESSNYIDEYNIYVGKVIDDNGNTYFPEDLRLISHWNLRDELKSQYAYEDGLFKQELIYNIMQRIIRQDIPENVINKNEFKWNPISNELFDDAGNKIEFNSEPNTRYEHLLKNFQILSEMDVFSPIYPTYIERKFEQDMQMSYDMVEELFINYLSSPVAKDVAELIKSRIGRDLQPFDIWYDGFKARSGISEEALTAVTKAKYPNVQALEDDLANIIEKLGFRRERAEHLASKINVDAARGAGHAWGAQMRGENARLRSRLPADGVDYKGFNIAMHELGHNVEQTFSLYDVDYYLLSGVPNTAFTEAMAFIFQRRDLDVLGMGSMTDETKHLAALDNFWSTFEIIGVSLVDIRVWKWLYENPNATAEELKNQVILTAGSVWNEYFSPLLGGQDDPLLAIYSHSISYPLYLSAYPLGHIIEFQIEEYLPGKHFGDEIERMCRIGNVSPNEWMQKAVGAPLSVEPLINAAKEAIGSIQ